MDHRAHAYQRSQMSHGHQRMYVCGTRRRHFLIALAFVIVLFSTGCGTSTSRSSASGFGASQMTAWLAKLFDINSPKWISGVIAGKPCSDQPAHAFCPDKFAITPDGKILALVARSGEIKVWDVAKRRLLLDEPGLAYKLYGQGDNQRALLLNEPGAAYNSLGYSDVWLSPDGRLVARAVYSDYWTSPPAVTIAFQVWNIATRQPLPADAPTPYSPWDPLAIVGLAPNELVLVFEDYKSQDWSWDWQRGHVEVNYHSKEKPVSISYVAGRAEWLLTLDGSYGIGTPPGYAIWTPSARPSIIRVPCDSYSQVSTNDNGELYACATGPVKLFPYVGNSVVIWDVTKRVESARLGDSRNLSSVMGFTFLNDGRSFAILASPPFGPIGDGPERLLLYSLAPHPAEDSVITLPGVSGGWGIYSIGGFAVAIGQSTRYTGTGYCCIKAVMRPVSQRRSP
jgi:WD40 repeat protein